MVPHMHNTLFKTIGGPQKNGSFQVHHKLWLYMTGAVLLRVISREIAELMWLEVSGKFSPPITTTGPICQKVYNWEKGHVAGKGAS